MGCPEEISAQILSETSLPKLIRARVTPGRNTGGWRTLLLVLGAPLWIPLLLAAVVCLLAGCIVVWSLVLALYAVNLALAISAAAGIAGMVMFLLQGNLPGAGLTLGVGLICAGPALLLFSGMGSVTGIAVRLSRSIPMRIKEQLIKRGNQK